MYQLQMKWNKEGEWLNTIWTLPLDQASMMIERLKYLHQEHTYRMIAKQSHDTPLFDEVYGG